MSVRFAKGGGPLAGLVRERQDLIARRQGEDRRLLAAVGKADGKAAEAIRTAIAELDERLDAIDKRLAAEFPEYASLASPKPLTLAAVQDLLKADEALIVFLDVPRFGRLPEETLAWAITKTTRAGPASRSARRRSASALRPCGAASTARVCGPGPAPPGAGRPTLPRAGRSRRPASPPIRRCRSTWPRRTSSIKRCSRRSPTSPRANA